MLSTYACRIFPAFPVCHEHTLGAVPAGSEPAATAALDAPNYRVYRYAGAPKHERHDPRHSRIRTGVRGKRRRIPSRPLDRFSDVEWETVEKAAAERGMNAAEFARHAALGVSSGTYGAELGPLPPQFAELVEQIFRSTHILVTLKHDELFREGRGEELDELVKSTQQLQKSLVDKPQN